MKNAITIFLFFLISFNLSAQDSPQKSRENIFISPVIETALYGYENINYGGGIAFGYGTGAAIGIRLVMFVDFDGGSALEFNCFIKYFVFGKETYSGLFINIMAGPVIFNRLDNFSFNT
ncbi:MAG: hypothetical protein FWD47_13285, partial [Treponema sp.]|nr:hypothetical protein [Treponema sp.]